MASIPAPRFLRFRAASASCTATTAIPAVGCAPGNLRASVVSMPACCSSAVPPSLPSKFLQGACMYHAGDDGRREIQASSRCQSTDQATCGARRASRADLFIVAPVFATATHPEARPLGPLRFGLLARQLPGPVAALGGITPDSARRLSGLRVCTLCATGWFAQHHAHGESTRSRVWWRLPRKRPPVRSSTQRDSRRFRTHVRLHPS